MISLYLFASNRMMRERILIHLKGTCVLLMLGLTSAHLQGQFVVNGSASVLSGNCFQLTPDQSAQTGNVFSQSTINLTQPFMQTAVMSFGCKDVNGADGIVFILSTTNAVTGTGGGEIGYGGMSPSLAVEYDDYQNGWGDPAQDHMAVISNGSLNHNAPSNLVGPTVLPNLEDCMDHCFSVTWDPVLLTLTATLDGASISYTGDIVNNIFGGNPNVYYGFSSGTGSLSNLHSICIGPPMLVPMDDITICEGEQAQLMADGNGIAWTWDPDPTLSQTNIVNPVASPVVTTTYHVTIDYPCGEVDLDDVQVTVIPEPVALAGNNGPLCVGELLQLAASGGNTYLWSGPGGFGSNLQSPQITPVSELQTGIYTVTVTDAAGCSATATTSVLVYPPTEVMIDDPPIPICEQGEPIQLTGTPSGGTWSGEVASNGVFDPVVAGTGMHLLTYTAIDANGCTSSAEVIVEVVPNTPALIIPEGPFCVNDPIQVLSATPAGGTWGDVAEPNGIIDPGLLGPGVFSVTYFYADQNGCFDAEIFIEIFDVPTVSISPIDPFCPGDSAQTLVSLPAGGTWSGDVGVNGVVDPSVLGPGDYTAVYQVPGEGGCIGVDTLSFSILETPPVVSNVNLICDSLGTGFVLSFEITGGDAMSYSVTGIPGGVLIPGNPYVFVSDTILQGGSYQLTVDDDNHCDPTMVAGSYACSCATQSGIMSPDPLVVCAGDSVVIGFAQGSILDPDDTLVYVLHHGSANFLDDPIATVANGIIVFAPPIQAGVQYYISAVAGNTGGSGFGVDFNDPCLSVSIGTPVMWVARPTGSLQAPSGLCAHDSARIFFALTGIGPFDLEIVIGSDSIFLNGVSDGDSISLLLLQTTSITLSTIFDTGGPGCLAVMDTPATIQVYQESIVQRQVSICAGDSIFLAGMMQMAPGIYLDSLFSVQGCDSLVETTLSVNALSSTQLFETSCDSLFIGEFVTVWSDVNGCDSTVIRTVTYAPADTSYSSDTTCDPSMAGIFMSVFQGSDGCDSIVIQTTALLPSDTVEVSGVTCIPGEEGLFIELLVNGDGCDSVVIETITLAPSWMIETYRETCDPAEAGVFVTDYVTALGCDSSVTEVVTLLSGDSTFLADITCEPRDTGVVVLSLNNMNGCDSLVIIHTVLDSDINCRQPNRNIYVPNVFSPNADNVNDIFLIYADPSVVVQINDLRVFDRWGALVWRAQAPFAPGDESFGWNGSMKGKTLDPGVFAWVAEVEYADGLQQVISGDITLVR